MTFTRTRYPDPRYSRSCPCWRLTGKNFYIDVDWNTRFPWGFSWGAGSRAWADTRQSARWSCCLDINAPLGEPNRLYLTAGGWHICLGLLSWSQRLVLDPEDAIRGWRRYLPHVDGCSRYTYRKAPDGTWVRREHPEPGHWGWLTVTRSDRKRDR